MFVSRTHILLLDLRGFSRHCVPHNDNGYVFTLLHMRILPHFRITTSPLMAITTTPYYHLRKELSLNNGMTL